MLWTFMEYISSGGRGVISEWYKELSIEAQAEFDDTLRFLAATPRSQWQRPEYSPLSKGISEIRFKANNKQYRPLGFFIAEKQQYVLVIGATKKMNVYTPADAIKTAGKRMKEIHEGRSEIIIYDQYEF